MYNTAIFTLPEHSAESGDAASLVLQRIRHIKCSVVCIYTTETIYWASWSTVFPTEASRHQLPLLSSFLFKGVILNSSSCQLPSGLDSFLAVNCADPIDWEGRSVAWVLICRKTKRKKERKINPFIICKPDTTNITSKVFVKLAKYARLTCRYSISWSCYGQDTLQKPVWDASSFFSILVIISVILFYKILRRQKSLQKKTN